MKVYCCSLFKECTQISHGGVYTVKRTFDDAQEEILSRIRKDFDWGFITTMPKLKETTFAGITSWEAAAFSKADANGHFWRYRYEITELTLEMRKKR